MKAWRNILGLGCLLAAIGGALGVMLIASSILYLAPQLPPVEALREVKLQTPLRIYSNDGFLISEFGEKRRAPVTYDQIPPLFTKALLAAEDQRFYDHHGVDIKGLTRAIVELITTGQKQTGGSTITMQVARNFFLTRKQTFMRKFNEILLAIQIERSLEKSDILTLYVNKIYLGHRAYGIGAAAQVYYGRSLEELSLAELAMIAGLPKAPSRYNPITNPERSRIRRDWILDRMKILGFIDEETHATATASPITAQFHGLTQELYAPYVAEMVRQSLLDKYGTTIYEDGFSVKTTIRGDLQAAARESVINGLVAYDQRHGYRGAEGKLDTEALTTFEGTNLAVQQATVREALSAYFNIGALIPAAVIAVTPSQATAMIESGRTYQISVEDMAWARRYVTVNRKGPEVSDATTVLNVGDIVRITPLNYIPGEQNTLDRESDNQAEAASEQPLRAKLSQVPNAQSALVSFGPDDGRLLALIGGLDFRISKFNRATQAARQAGSSIKPFIYGAALENGFTAASLINDAPLVFRDQHLESVWRPENSGGRFNGPTRIRQALYQSRNLVSIRLLREIGIDTAISALARYGFDETKLPKNLSLALGSAALTPYKVATHYNVLANGGYRVEPYFIDEIKNSEGDVIFKAVPVRVCPDCASTPSQQAIGSAQAKVLSQLDETLKLMGDEHAQLSAQPKNAERVMDEQLWYITRSMLSDVIQFGTGRRAKALGRKDLAGKTGTTNDQKDAWFSGFQKNNVTTVWVGFDDPATLGAREYGGTAALPIWIDYMRVALKGVPDELPNAPAGLLTVRIDPETGERAAPGQDNAIFEVFRAEYAPTGSKAGNTAINGGNAKTRLDEIF
jgi:penicillin-binding protein 1A